MTVRARFEERPRRPPALSPPRSGGGGSGPACPRPDTDRRTRSPSLGAPRRASTSARHGPASCSPRSRAVAVTASNSAAAASPPPRRRRCLRAALPARVPSSSLPRPPWPSAQPILSRRSGLPVQWTCSPRPVYGHAPYVIPQPIIVQDSHTSFPGWATASPTWPQLIGKCLNQRLRQGLRIKIPSSRTTSPIMHFIRVSPPVLLGDVVQNSASLQVAEKVRRIVLDTQGVDSKRSFPFEPEQISRDKYYMVKTCRGC